VSEAPGDRSISILQSVLVHAAVVALLGWGWWHFRKPPVPPRQLAIEATVVMASEATPAPTPQAAAPAAVAPPPPVAPTPPPSPEPVPAPKPTPKPAAEAVRAEQAAQREAERERRASEQRQREAEAQAAAQAAADKAAKLKAQQAAQDKARREAELRAQLASEERVNAARSSAEMASYLALITGRINRAWIRPPSVRAGLNCELHVTQVPGGEVTGVQIASCNGDQAARESIEAAVYRASPLPSPSNPDLFDRSLTIRFHPDE